MVKMPSYRGVRQGGQKRPMFRRVSESIGLPMLGWLLPPVSRGRSALAGSGRKGGDVVFPFFALPFFRGSWVYEWLKAAKLQGPQYLGFGHQMFSAPRDSGKAASDYCIM